VLCGEWSTLHEKLASVPVTTHDGIVTHPTSPFAVMPCCCCVLQLIVQLACEADKDGRRTVGVLTKG
jgi:hypothetical protein